MQLLAHNGPNWSPGALAVQPCHDWIAVGVRNTVVFYDFEGRFIGEIRAVGRGRVSALSFCEAPALTHLLAVGTSEGFVRVYDAQTRRIFRKVREPAQGKKKRLSIFALRFVNRFPNVLLVVTEPNQICMWKYETAENIRCVFDMFLDVRIITCVTLIPGSSELLLVAGLLQDEAGEGIAMVIDVSRNERPSIFHKGAIVNDLVTSVRDEASGSHHFFLLMVSAYCKRPVIYKSLDGVSWSALESSSQTSTPSWIDTTDETPLRERTSRDRTPSHYYCSGTWCGQRDLVVSNPRGTIVHYHIDGNNRLQERTHRQSAHIRQIFSMKALKTKYQFVTSSMDRTVALWQLDSSTSDEPSIKLKCRTPRTNGPIKSLAISLPNQLSETKMATGRGGRCNSFVSFATNDTITFLSCIENGSCDVIGEISPIGNTVRKRETIESVTRMATRENGEFPNRTDKTSLFLFATSNGRVGLIRLLNGELQFVFSRKRKCQNNSKEQKSRLLAVHGDTAITSISGSGDLETMMLPLSERAWAEARNSPKQWPAGSLCLRADETTPKASAACRIQQQNGDECLLCLGYEDGTLALFNISGGLVAGPVVTGLARVLCIAHKWVQHTIVASDGDCGIVTISADGISFSSHAGSESQPLLRIHHHHQNLVDGIRSLIWSPSASTNDACAVERSTYLVAITNRGEIYVWIYQENEELVLRAHIKSLYGRVSCCVWESYHCLLSGGEDGSIRRWELEKQPWPSPGKPRK